MVGGGRGIVVSQGEGASGGDCGDGREVRVGVRSDWGWRWDGWVMNVVVGVR